MRVKLFLVFSFCLAAGSDPAIGQVTGCTDPAALNYNSGASLNDGSCLYAPASVAPVSTFLLSDTIPESSGLIWWDNHVWTHNDNTDVHLYALDTVSGHTVHALSIPGVDNQDWEEITQDDDYVYIGDFGNNGSGNRQNLHILRVAKASLTGTAVTVDTIWFSYPDQTSFAGTGLNNTDFDCEAFVAGGDSLYLFSKQWVSKKTTVYALPKLPGTYVATLKYSYNVQGLITGATCIPGKRAIVLCGYNTNSSTYLNPFFYLLYDFQGTDFFSGNKRKIDLSQAFSQMEGIATVDGRSFFISNEKITNSIITIPARLQKVNLSAFLQPYYQSLTVKSLLSSDKVEVYPNPSQGILNIAVRAPAAILVQLVLGDAGGRLIISQKRTLHVGSNKLVLDISQVGNGNYWLSIVSGETAVRKKVVINNR